LDIYRFDASAADSESGGTWLTPAVAATRLPQAPAPAGDLTLACLLAR
jgi:hypothetical protein